MPLKKDASGRRWVEVETEVVAGSEVRQPPVPDADHAPVDLVGFVYVHHVIAADARRGAARASRRKRSFAVGFAT